MNSERTFTNVDDAVLVKLISQASHRVVLLSFIIAGLGLVWAARPEKVTVPALQPVATPA